MKNPNPFNAKVDRISYTVYVSDNQVTSGSTPKAITIPANSEREIKDRVEVDLGGALGAGVDALANGLTGETTYVRIDGNLHVDAGPATFSIPFSRRKPL